MSILKTIYLQHLNGGSPNATLDANGNMTVTGTVAGAYSDMFRNRIINGDMRIDQRNAGAAVTITSGNAGYAADRFITDHLSDAVLTAQQVADAPAGFINSTRVTVSTPDASIGSTQYAQTLQRIEGFNIADLNWGTVNAQTVTVSFWVKSTVAGQYPVRLVNADGTRSYPFYITVNTTNTWEFKTKTIPGPTNGTFATNNNTGIALGFTWAVGTTYSGATENTWNTTVGYVASNLTNNTGFIATSGATFYITGVQLEAGTISTPFERRPYGTELALCQRYCWVNGGVAGQQYAVHGMGYIYGSTGATITIFPPVEMRDVPSLSSSGSFRIYDGGSAFAATVPASLNTSNSTRRVFVLEPSASGMTQYRPCNLSSNNDATAKLILSAEL